MNVPVTEGSDARADRLLPLYEGRDTHAAAGRGQAANNAAAVGIVEIFRNN